MHFSPGKRVDQVSRELEITEHSNCHRRKEYGGRKSFSTALGADSKHESAKFSLTFFRNQSKSKSIHDVLGPTSTTVVYDKIT